jgi:hypothetical protein
MSGAKEGELYSVVNVFGKTFKIYYGYYEEYERKSKYNDPVPIYPDLKKNPEYDADGYGLVTEMQVSCEKYCGPLGTDNCGSCAHFEKGEKLFGLCKNEERRKFIDEK